MAAFLLASLLAQPVAAAEAVKSAPAVASAATTNWKVNGVRKTDGSFGFCRAETVDASTGLMLAVALSAAQEINIGIRVPPAKNGGGFKKGETFALTLAVDTAWSKPVTAEAMLPELLLMKLGNDQAFLPALAKGSTLTAKGDSDATTFKLAGAATMVADLKQCVAEGQKSAGPPTLPQGLAALLREAKLDVKPLALAGGKGAQAVDVAWTVVEQGTTLDGGFREARAAKGDSFKTLSDGTIGQLKGQCKPGLQIEGGKAEAEQSVTLATYDLTCGPEVATLLAYRTQSDIYGVLIHRAPVADKAKAIAVRDRLAAIIRRLGNEAMEGPAKAAPAKPAAPPAAPTKK